MVELHVATGVAMLALNLAAGVWGAIAWLTERPSLHFWYLLRAAQASILLEVLLGSTLLILGYTAEDPIHYMYGTLPLLVSVVAEGMRAGAAQRVLPEGVDFRSLGESEQRTLALGIVQREMGIMTVAALVNAAAAFRAAQVSGGLF